MNVERSHIVELFRDEDAQATTEYIIMIVVLVGLATMVVRKLISPIMTKLVSILGGRIDQMFSEQNLHSFRIGR